MPIALNSTRSTTPSPGLKPQISRRPSPWSDLAHSLSETPIQPHTLRRKSSIASPTATPPISLPLAANPQPIPFATIPSGTPTSPSPSLSSSALREWERLLLDSPDQAKRHHLHHPAPPSLHHASSSASLGAPKLAAERDKEGHIEYKLKLIDPTPERFERLVTQMLWRLKQGRNEAIYELGLAGLFVADSPDDGTVIGLTRAEMDASLHTLEQMAAEVGATVIVLKEIVLSGAAVNLPARARLFSHSTASIASTSASSAASSSGHRDRQLHHVPGIGNVSEELNPTISHADGSGIERNRSWVVRRPDLDETGLPRRGSRSISETGTPIAPDVPEKKRWRNHNDPEKAGWGSKWREKQVIFDPDDLHRAEDSDEDDEFLKDPDASPGSTSAPSQSNGIRRNQQSEADDRAEDPADDGEMDEDIPPFHLDLDEPTTSVVCNPDREKDLNSLPRGGSEGDERKWKRWKMKSTVPAPKPAVTKDASAEKRLSTKAMRAAAKREERRLSLFRGDGTNPMWTAMAVDVSKADNSQSPDEALSNISSKQACESSAVESATFPSQDAVTSTTSSVVSPVLLHQPLRPSSLRLATPATPSSSSSSSSPSDTFLVDLLHIPLDNLSLSFAEVQTVTEPAVAARPGSGPSSSSVSRSRSSTASSVRSSDSGISTVSTVNCTPLEPEEEGTPSAVVDTHTTETDHSIPIREKSISAAQGRPDYDLPSPWDNLRSEAGITYGDTTLEQELVCVEALVVRKTAEGVAGVSEWCENGEDGWGLGDEEDNEAE